MTRPYAETQPTRDEIDALQAPTVLEFGANWCSVCAASQPSISAAMAAYPGVTHLKVADGKGYPLGRSFGVKLWPTLVFLRGGREVERLVRPRGQEDIDAALTRLLTTA